MPRMLRAPTRALRVAALGLLAVALLGCRADLVAPIELTADGGATAGLAVRFDARMLAELDALGVDPTAELGAVVAEDSRWELVRTRDDGGGLTVAVTRRVDDAGDLGDVYRDLAAGLAPSDPALVLDLDEPRGVSSTIVQVSFQRSSAPSPSGRFSRVPSPSAGDPLELVVVGHDPHVGGQLADRGLHVLGLDRERDLAGVFEPGQLLLGLALDDEQLLALLDVPGRAASAWSRPAGGSSASRSSPSSAPSPRPPAARRRLDGLGRVDEHRDRPASWPSR
jgi:hypothetical protein